MKVPSMSCSLKRQRLFDAQAHGMNRFSKLMQELLATYYTPVKNACKQYNFEVLLEVVKPLAEANENNASSHNECTSLDLILNKTSVPAAKIGELLHLSVYLRTAKVANKNDVNDAGFGLQQQDPLSIENNADSEMLQNLVNVLRANLVQCAVFLDDLQYDRLLQELLQRATAVVRKTARTQADCGADNLGSIDADDSPIVVPLNKAVSIVAILANICYYFTNRGVDRVYVSNACNSGLLFLKRYAMHTLTVFSSNTSHISSSNAQELVRDIEVRVADCFINIGRMFSNAAPGFFTDQVAYSALTTCMQLFRLQPLIFDSYWGDTLLTSAVNVTPLLLPHMHRTGGGETDGNDADTGYQEDALLFFELSSAIIHSPMAVSSSRAALYAVSGECKIHFTTAMFLICCHSVHSPSQHSELSAALNTVSDEDVTGTTMACLQHQQLCDRQVALLKCHDFAYMFLRNLFDKLSLTKTKKGGNDEDVSFEVFQCFCDDLLNCLGEPLFPLVPKLLALLFRIFLAKLEVNRKSATKHSTSGNTGGTNGDKHALVLDLLTSMIIRVKTFCCSRNAQSKRQVEIDGDFSIEKQYNRNDNVVPLSQQSSATAFTETLDAEIGEFISSNQIHFKLAVEDLCGLGIDDRPLEQSAAVDRLKTVTVQAVEQPLLPESIHVGQTVLLELFVTHQLLKKCQADNSLFDLVQVLHSTWHKYKRSADGNDESIDEQSICMRAREHFAVVQDASKNISSKKPNFRQSRLRKSDSFKMDVDESAADSEPESGPSSLTLARYELHNHLVTINTLAVIAKQVKVQWGGGQIFSSTKGADDELLNTAYRFLLLKHGFLNDRIIARIRPLVVWALKSGSALAASKVTRCLSTLIEVDPFMAHDKHLLRALKSQMLHATPSVTSACLDCIHNIMMSARTQTSLNRNLPIILSRLTDPSKSVRRKSMKMIAQLIDNAELRAILVRGNVDTDELAKPAVTLCCKTAAWLILAVNGECFTSEASGGELSVHFAAELEAEDTVMRDLATTALSQLLMHLLLATPVVNADSSSDGRDVVGDRQIEFFTTLMRVLRDICLLPSFSSNSKHRLSAITDYGSGGDSSSRQDTTYTLYAKKIGIALKTVLDENVPLTAEMQLLVHRASTTLRTRSRGTFYAGDLALAGGGPKKRISENLLVVFRRLAQYAVTEMQEQIRRLLHLRVHEADNNVPIDEQLELVTQFIGQLIEVRPTLFTEPMVDRFAQILHQLVWNLQQPQQPLQNQQEDDWRYRALYSLMHVLTRLARCGVINAAKPAPVVIAPDNHHQGPDAVIVGPIVDDNSSSPNSAATLTGLIRKSIRWFLLRHAYVEPLTCDRFVECWIAVADLERRTFAMSAQHNIRRTPSSSQPQDEEFVHGRGYADICGQFERLFNMMRVTCDNMLLPMSAGDAAAQQQRQWNNRHKKLITCIQITAYIWRHLPSLAMLNLAADDSEVAAANGRTTSTVKQYILRVLLLCFQFATTRNQSAGTAGSVINSSAIFKRSLLRLTPSDFRALETTLRCVGLFAVHYPELLQHPILAGQYLRDILELSVPPASSAASSAAGQQRQQYNLTAKWLYQLKFRIIRIYLQIMDHAFPAFAASYSLLTTNGRLVSSGPVDNEYDDITDVEQRDANSDAVRTERIVTVLMQDHIEQFMQCGSSASSLLRAECFLLVQKVFRCRLMLPDRYIPYIIALTCDNSPTIVDAAASLLAEVETRYPTFLARAALQGVDHAFRHRCRILTERAMAVGVAVDFSASAGVVHGFVHSGDDQSGSSNNNHDDERQSLLFHLMRVIYSASPSPRQAVFTLFRNLINRFGDMSVGTTSTQAVGSSAAEMATAHNASSADYDLDERLQWQLFIAGSLIYLPFATKDELIYLLKAVSDRLHPFGSEHFDNLMSSLVARSSSAEEKNGMICLQGEQVVKLLDALFTPALLATIKLQLMKMYNIDERELLHNVVAGSVVDENLKKQPMSSITKSATNSSSITAQLSVLKPVSRLSFERTKVVANLALLIPMLRQQKVALQMQYRRHHQASFRIDWKLELNAEQLHILVDPLKKAVMRAWGDFDENDAEKVAEVEPGYVDECRRVGDEDDGRPATVDYAASSAAGALTPPVARKQSARKATSSATFAGNKHKSRLLAVKKTATSLSPNRTPKRSRHRKKSCESSSSDDSDLMASSSNDDDSNDSMKTRKIKPTSRQKSAVKRRKLDGDDDDEDFQPKVSTPVKSALSKVQSIETPEKFLPNNRSTSRPTRQSASLALQRLTKVEKNDDSD